MGLVALCLASGSALAATRIVPAESVGPQDVPQVQILSTDRSGVDLLLELPALSMETLTVEGQQFQSVAIPGGGLDGDDRPPGNPDLHPPRADSGRVGRHGDSQPDG